MEKVNNLMGCQARRNFKVIRKEIDKFEQRVQSPNHLKNKCQVADQNIVMVKLQSKMLISKKYASMRNDVVDGVPKLHRSFSADWCIATFPAISEPGKVPDWLKNLTRGNQN